MFLKSTSKKTTVLIISQVYVPDPASVGQHLHDLARELTHQNKRVIVFTPRGGYDDPSCKYAWHQTIDGVKVIRLPFCAFGKKLVIWRLLSGISLTIQSMLLGIFIRNLTHVLVSTIPPMSAIAACFIGLFKRIKIVFWAMDINPDQLIALDKISTTSVIAKICDSVNSLILSSVDFIVTLDEYMGKRLISKVNKNIKLQQKLHIIPPWPYENQLVSIDHEANHFRKDNALDGKFVVMYSGNITSVHPIDTLLEAILRLRKNKHIVFLFIGSELACKKLKLFTYKNSLTNLRTLPYVPFNETQYSLSAADLHIVSMGNNLVGIVHPCKVYGIMSVGRPFLAFGPKRSHVGEILESASVGWLVEHGDVDGTVKILEKVSLFPKKELASMGAVGQNLIKQKYSHNVLCHKFCQFFEDVSSS